MRNSFLLKSLLLILSPPLIISFLYFLFLSQPMYFTKILERYNYQDFIFSFEQIATNKNPLYPEISFTDVSLKRDSKTIKLDELKIGLSLLGFVFDGIQRVDYLKIGATQITIEDYKSLLPENSITLRNTISRIIQEGKIEKLNFELINGSDASLNNELIISELILNIGSDSKLFAKKALVSANSKEVKAILDDGTFDNLPFERISGLLDINLMQLSYETQHISINEYAQNILPLGVLNFQNDIELFTSGFMDFKNDKNKNYGFISFQDLSEIKYLEDGFNVKTRIFIEDFKNIFSQTFISFDDFRINLYLSGNEIQNSSNINFFTDTKSSIDLSGNFNDGNLQLDFNSENLRGSLVRDKSNFFRVDLYDSNITFDFEDSEEGSFTLPNLKFRFTGKDITFNDAKVDSVDFYYLKNGEILTLNDINIQSNFLNISMYENEPAYFSINTNQDFYKIKGTYELKDFKNSLKLKNFPSVNYLRSNINIQWNNLLELKNIEGKLNFLAKDFQINQENPNSALLNLIGLLNIQSFFDGYDGASTQEYIKFRRGSGSIIFSKKYGRIIDDFSFEADFGNMDWTGFIIKDDIGSFKELDLGLSLKLNLQENIPWYAAIFGGIGMAAGTAIIGNVFEDQIEQISTIQYKVKGPLDAPDLERL